MKKYKVPQYLITEILNIENRHFGFNRKNIYVRLESLFENYAKGILNEN